MVFQNLLNPILSPLLLLNPFFAIVLIAFLISLSIILVYKKVTDQNLMKKLKDEIKELQKEMKSLKDNPEKAMEVNKRLMETNSKYMMQSFKPTLFTFIPIILIFGWLNAHMGYYPIVGGDDFTVTVQFTDGTSGQIELLNLPKGIELLKNGQTQEILNDKAEWFLRGDPGTYTLSYKLNNKDTFEHQLIIDEKWEDRSYAKPELKYKELKLDKDAGVVKLIISNKKVYPFQEVPLLGSIPWFGNFGWLGTYITFSLIFSIALRRLLKVY